MNFTGRLARIVVFSAVAASSDGGDADRAAGRTGFDG